MKLTYFTSLTLPSEWAHSIQITQMCEAFTEAGAEEITLVFPKRSLAASSDLYGYHGVKTNFSLHSIKPLDVYPTSPGKFWYYLRTLTFLVQAWPRIVFDRESVVYIREPILGFFLPKFFLEIHSVPKKPGFLFKLVLRRAKGIITITSSLRDIIHSWGIAENKILVAPSAVDTKVFDLRLSKKEAREKLGLPPDAVFITYVGGFGAVGLPKGIDTLIEMITVLPENYKLLLVGGDSSGIEKFKKYAAAKEVQDRVIFVGQVPHSSTPQYMQAADILIAPYPDFDFYKYHTSPLKVFEYMAAGRPIITTDFPTLRDILDDTSAILVKTGDVAGYAEAVKKIIQNPTLADKLVSNAREKVENNTWRKRAEEILAFVQSRLS